MSPRILTLALMMTGCAVDAAPPDTFIAFGRDFESYRSWTAIEQLDPVPPTHESRSVIYIDALPEPGSAAFDVGTRIVKVELHGEDPTTWELHAMVKRGGGYNPDGAVGWEFFELAHLDDGPPLIVWRGEGPSTGNGYVPADGSDDVLGCNHCHAAFPENDSVLSPALDLSTLPPE